MDIYPRVEVRYVDCLPDVDAERLRGGVLEARIVSHAEEIYTLVRENPKYSVIAVDEAFMIEGIDDVLIDLYKSNSFSIIVSSIQMDAGEVPFENIKNLLPFATKIEVCPAVCSSCGSDAHYTLKTGGRSDHRIEVGGPEMYQPKCFLHFYPQGSEQI